MEQPNTWTKKSVNLLALFFALAPKEYDLIVNQHIQYAAALSKGYFMTGNKNLEYYNPGLTESVEVHEDVHFSRNVKAVNMNITITDPFKPGHAKPAAAAI